MVTVFALFTPSMNITAFNLWTIWLLIAFIVMVLYELWWIRYFKGEHTLHDFYSNFMGVPGAGASLPILAFVLLGIYGRSIVMLISVTLFGVGHIGIHLDHKKTISKMKSE